MKLSLVLCCYVCSAFHRANGSTQPGSDLQNIFTLRTIADANSIFKALAKDSNVVIVGASFIGKYTIV